MPAIADSLAPDPQAQLAALFADGEWPTERVWLRRRADRNPFMSANIVLILERCTGLSQALRDQSALARERMACYRDGHLVYHWPFENGRSRMTDAPVASRLPWMQISPDADCAALVHLARHEAPEGLRRELEFYRADGRQFRLPQYQRQLPAVTGSYLTWFPERARCGPGKLETVDVGASSNILWYLGASGQLATPGAAETVAFVAAVVRAGLVLREPFRLSLYYPRPAVLLFLIARAAVWGNVATLVALRSELLAQLERCPAPTSVEALCRASASRLLGGPDYPVPVPDGRGAFYVAPLLAWPLQRLAAVEPLARRSFTQWDFRCIALEWVLYLWLRRPG